MSKTDVSIIAIKILALYLIAIGITELPNAYVLANLDPNNDIWGHEMFLFISAVLTPLTLGIILLFFSNKIGEVITPKSQNTKGTNINNSELLAISFAVLGLYLTSLLLHKISYYIASTYYQNYSLITDKNYFDNPAFVALVVSLIFSLSLFIGTKFWVKLFYAFQEFGLKNKTSNKAIKKDV